MPSLASLAGIRLATLGFNVERAAATLPATTSTNYFAIAGGRVIVTSLVGEVTTIVQTQANNAKWISTPTVGTAVDICAVLNITASEVGALMSITGLTTDALQGGVAAGAGAVSGMARQLIVPIGNLKFSTSATNTGATKWTITYVPIDAGAVVTAV